MKFSDCQDDIGKNLLQNPLDLCVTKKGELVVADDSNGVLIFKRSDSNGLYEFENQIKGLRDAGSLAYHGDTDTIYISIAKPPDNKKILAEVDCSTWKVKREMEIPTKPAMRAGFINWVAVSDSYAFVMSGDNNVAIIWRIELSAFRAFDVVLETKGDLEHPHVLDDENLLVARWTVEEDWSITKVTITNTGEASLKTLIKSMPGLTEPWSFAVDAASDSLIVYDYPTGALVVFAKQGEEQYALVDSPAKVPFGQWVSMKACNGKLFVTCSDERVVREFT